MRSEVTVEITKVLKCESGEAADELLACIDYRPV